MLLPRDTQMNRLQLRHRAWMGLRRKVALWWRVCFCRLSGFGKPVDSTCRRFGSAAVSHCHVHSSLATGNSSDAPFWVKVATNPSFVAEFSYDGNLGIGFRGFWGAGEGVQSPRGNTVKERAELWFEKS
ncbi:hypothetical protein C8R43DRAFT_97218 [Mycena crocata]|nr:hypothetical protein C8R43DRAFT_97218 [Mycena crocata]